MIRDGIRSTTPQPTYPTNGHTGGSPAPAGNSPPWLASVAAGIIVAMVIAGIFGFTLGHQSSKAAVPAIPGVLAEEYIGEHHIPLIDHADGPIWLSYYKINAGLLGQPLRGEGTFGKSQDCVVFTNYVVCHSPDPSLQGSDWEYAPAGLGYQFSGNLPPQLDAPRAPIVQQFIDQVLTPSARDWGYWLGRTITPAVCPVSGGECTQAFENMILHWPNRPDAGAKDVQLSPLGQETLRP